MLVVVHTTAYTVIGPKDELQHIDYADKVSHFDYPRFPEPMGVFRAVEHDVYEEMVRGQNRTAEKKGIGDLQSLITGDETWTVA